jgi:AcrR family transcriptional regulator
MFDYAPYMGRDTREAVLEAAERLFAENGFRRTTLRAITRAAGVNLAAVNYHFGSKQALVEAVFARRIRPMNQERLRRLAAWESAGDGDLEGLIDAFAGPPLELATRPGGAVFVRLLGRSYTEPDERLQAALRDLYEPVIERFKQAFARALPELPAPELYWRLHFLVGLLAYLMSGADFMRLIASCRLCDPLDTESLKARLRGFVAAGLRAPAPAEVDHG